LAQAYQPLRTWWETGPEDDANGALSERVPVVATEQRVREVSIAMLEDTVLEWLEADDRTDRIRLLSGGPGSGKSTFAKRLAAALALQARWRVVFVPLQRLRGTGPLESRINDYFRRERLGFGAEISPLSDIGRDAHRDWVIIFDGLDELAKEGASSESAAQDFATALADFRLAIAQSASVRFIVLGRAPSMQKASRRLGLAGPGTLHVADMRPFEKPPGNPSSHGVKVHDSLKLQHIDQRKEFWLRWAAAKGVSKEVPRAMTAEALSDLTKEPLLAYLLILSGYTGPKWNEAAENRNRIYSAIFDRIWERERDKPTRIRLNELGKPGFESLMQALGIAAWRGGGRTGDESAFISVRDVLMSQKIREKAKNCGIDDLESVALLFYTRRDEEGGQGYEFLHKSFGEYLTARGLFGVFERWARQIDDPESDLRPEEFFRRWLRLAGPTAVTREILIFLRDEVRLVASSSGGQESWTRARAWMKALEPLIDQMFRDGLPAHENVKTWREAETVQGNAEQGLLALLDSCARVAFPSTLYGVDEAIGGWQAGPVHIPALTEDSRVLFALSSRQLEREWQPLLSRIKYKPELSAAECRLVYADFEGACAIRARFHFAFYVRMNCTNANLSGSTFHESFLDDSNFQGADLSYTNLSNASMSSVDFTSANLKKPG
jgi:hypothetical protein